jgi:hypothetical protein
MIYLYIYLGIGAVALAVIFISHRLTRSPGADDIDDLMLALDSRADRWWWKPINKVVVPTLAALAVLVFWPAAIVLKAKELIVARHPAHVELPKEFAVTQSHLRRQWAVAEIEAAEVVVDPLDAAPRIPFGHLNPAWEAFKQSLLVDDQVWSFSARWEPRWGPEEIREGYVALRGDTIGSHFLTRRSRIAPQSAE